MADKTEGKARSNGCTRHFKWYMISWIVIVLYVLFGGVIFKLTESQRDHQQHKDGQKSKTTDNTTLVISDGSSTKPPTLDVSLLRLELLQSLHGIWSNDPENWTTQATNMLTSHEHQMNKIAKRTQDSQQEEKIANSDEWETKYDFGDWFNSCFFCLTVITTIGYGHMTPQTVYGIIAFVIYSVVGIPLFFMYIFKLGEHLSQPVKRVYWYVRCLIVRLWSSVFGGRSYETNEQFRELQNPDNDNIQRIDLENIAEEDEEGEEPSVSQGQRVKAVDRQTPDTHTIVITDRTSLGYVEVPIFVLLIVVIVYILIFSAIFQEMEDWNYGPAFYFSLVTLTTIGFGDLLPATDPASKHLVVSLYIIFGWRNVRPELKVKGDHTTGL
ncbi:potassium channel subfamily K member 18-like [Glandiceps talaboti]